MNITSLTVIWIRLYDFLFQLLSTAPSAHPQLGSNVLHCADVIVDYVSKPEVYLYTRETFLIPVSKINQQ